MTESVPILDPEIAALLGVECANLGDIDPATISRLCPSGRPYINQNGVRPGQRKLEQFRKAFELRNTPPLYGTEEIKRDDKIIRVKLFDPCGSASWFFAEFSLVAPDGVPDLGYSYVTGLSEDEWGYTSLQELADLKGRMGIGIEIDCWFTPITFGQLKQQLRAEDAEGEAHYIESQQQ